MTNRAVGLEILEGIKEIKAHKAGTVSLRQRELSEPSSAKAIRQKLNLPQADFASLMGVSVRTIQDWEQGRRQPSGPAKSLLRIAEQHPDIFLELA